ncbi:hypothetical protein ABFY27_15115 [Akkermansia massiliensis]
MGYTSTTAGGQDKWVSMFHICDESLAPGEKSNFTGTVKLDNYILYSEADSPPMRMPTTTSWPSGSPAPYSSSWKTMRCGTPRWT